MFNFCILALLLQITVRKSDLEGRLFESLAEKKSEDYVKVINEIIASIEGEEEVPKKVKEKKKFKNPLKTLKWMGGVK